MYVKLNGETPKPEPHRPETSSHKTDSTLQSSQAAIHPIRVDRRYMNKRRILASASMQAARSRHDILGEDRRCADRARQHRFEIMPAIDVAVQHGWPAVVSVMRVSPMNQRQDHGIEVESLLAQPILITLRTFLVRNPIQHAICNQTGEAFGQDATGNSKPALKFLEPSYFQKCFAKYEQCPAIADDRESAS
jgi:hypothetical protein